MSEPEAPTTIEHSSTKSSSDTEVLSRATVLDSILSKYKGAILDGKYHGKGEYESSIGRYVGEFSNGKFNGQGTMFVKEGKFEGFWKDDVMVDGKYVFDDGLKYKHTGEKYWNYCCGEDTRFHQEVVENVPKNGPFSLISAHKKKMIIPVSCYDCGDGIYDSRKNVVISHITGGEIRIPDEREQDWIVQNCRIGV